MQAQRRMGFQLPPWHRRLPFRFVILRSTGPPQNVRTPFSPSRAALLPAVPSPDHRPPLPDVNPSSYRDGRWSHLPPSSSSVPSHSTAHGRRCRSLDLPRPIAPGSSLLWRATSFSSRPCPPDSALSFFLFAASAMGSANGGGLGLLKGRAFV
jgi:hypothetical protein